MVNRSQKILLVLQIVVFLGFLILPYYLFDGKLFIGGDDTRLFYIFPSEWIHNMAFYSWYHASSDGLNNPNQFLLPFLSIWSLVHFIIPSVVVIDYLSFSLPLILGFIYFQYLINELVFDKENKYQLIRFTGALIYTLSPILIYDQLSVFLYSSYLIGLFPIILYYFIKYFKTDDFKYIFINILWCIYLAFSIASVPWLLGMFFPLVLSLIICSSIFRGNIKSFLKRSFIFYGLLISSQAFWIFSIIISILFNHGNSFVGTALAIQDTFKSTVLSTASGNIIYPLLNLFHRKITMDYNSSLKPVFLTFYDITLILDSIYVVILFIAIFNFKKYLKDSEKKNYLMFFIAFLLSLFFFTVHIGPLENIFLFMGHIPGFVMFRNFNDKFAPGYAFLYSLILTLSLIIVSRKFDKWNNTIIVGLFLVIMINVIPIKQIINKPLWTTKNIYTTITIPDEYNDFMLQVSRVVPQSANILSLPFNIAAYTFIKDKDSINMFIGGSPVQVFTGITDFSGELSFGSDNENVINDIMKRQYKDLNQILQRHNIQYIFVTKNLPQELKKSYLFSGNILSYQDKQFENALFGKKILQSTKRDYILYKTKYTTSLFQSKNLNFQKINPITFHLTIKNIKHPQELLFLDSYNYGWKLYPEVYTSSNNEFLFLFKKDAFTNSHSILGSYANQWIIDPNTLKKSFPPDYYFTNPDGSINIKLILYFEPQENFYIGSFISILTLAGSFGYLLYSMRRKYR